MQNDSTDKIISRYFATLTRDPFEYRGKQYEPRAVKVSPLLLRDYTCPPMCGGCCFKFTLDYLPSEDRPPEAKKRLVQFDGRDVEVYTDAQESNTGNRCTHLDAREGRCGIYTVRPFSCDFELIRTLWTDDTSRPNVLTQKLFGRGWSYDRVDGGKGALCEMKPITKESIAEVIRKLRRFIAWADHFQIKTHANELVDIIEKGHLTEQIIFHPPSKRKGFGL